ncbi:MAG: 5'-methylthioadenosine/adenosylhomocysteine nucleosidase [Clostridia bacterium]|nr:5'-methylthioadenosine/adenosylhomocysteine nucleosidase [Clostridia bacterium]
MSNLIGIIGAMDIEVDGLISLAVDKSDEVVSGIRFVKGKIANKDVVIAKCGIGKVFAAICAQTMLLRYNPSIIINSGVAGTLTKDLSVMDVAIADKVVQHDMDTSALGDPRGLISGINIIYMEADERIKNTLKSACISLDCNGKIGTIASGDKFIAETAQKEEIKTTFGAIACEMEGASIGHVCYVNKIPFGIIRTISDGEGAEMDYTTFSQEAATQSIKIVEKFIQIYE